LSKDKGIGVFSVVAETKGKVQISIYEKSSSKSKVIGLFLCNNTDEGQMDYQVQVKGMKADNLLEFGYEKSGIPISETNKDWIKVIYGFDHSDKPLTGWVENKKGITNCILWKNYFKESMLFFESPDSIVFFNEPNGKSIEFKLQPSQNFKYDYIMKPLETKGIWMKVEVTTPSDYCATPEVKETKMLWIKYLSQNGRPLIWYFTRGC